MVHVVLSLVFILAGSVFGIGADYNRDGIVNLKDFNMAVAGGQYNSRVMAVMREWLMSSDKWLKFDGVDGIVTVLDNEALDLSTLSFSVTAAIEFGPTLNGAFSISKHDGVYTGFYLYLTPQGYLSIEYSSESGGTVLGFNTTLQDDLIDTSKRFILTVVFDVPNTTVTVYVNGSLHKSFDYSDSGQPDITNTTNLIIGLWDTVYFEGYADDIRIYGKALTAAEVALIAARGIGSKYSPLDANKAIVAWDMDEGAGTTITDKVTGLVGTLSGGVTWAIGGTPFMDNQAAITKSEIEDFVEECLEDTVADASLVKAINLCLQDLSNMGLLAGTDESRSLADGDTSFPVPYKYKDMESVQVVGDDGVLNDPLRNISGGYKEYLLLMAESNATGTPEYYCEHKGRIYVYPPADGNYDVNLTCTKYDRQDPDNIEFGPEFSNALKFGTTYFYAMMKGRERYKALWEAQYLTEKEFRRLNKRHNPCITE